MPAVLCDLCYQAIFQVSEYGDPVIKKKQVGDKREKAQKNVKSAGECKENREAPKGKAE